MNTAMTVMQDLTREWRRMVVAGKFVSEFEVNGEKLQRGLRIGRDGEIEDFAYNLTSGKPIEAIIEEREIEDSNIILQYNGFRALKPGGKVMSPGRQLDIPSGPEVCGFGCQWPDKPMSLLQRDPIIDYATIGWHMCTYHNAVPFEKMGHFLWVPTKLHGTSYVIPHFPQKLTRDFLEGALTLFRDSSGLIVFFNSRHAGASVDHIHFQAVCHTKRLAIESARLEPFGPHKIFSSGPINGIAFPRNVEVDELFPFVDLLQQKEYPFNLIMIGERVNLVPRDADNEVVSEFPSGVIAAMELCGKFIVSSREVYDAATAKTLFTALKKATQEKYRINALFESLIKGK